MAARFTDTEIWSEDWFCDLAGEYQLFFMFICSKCDNAGVWKPNKIDFEIKSKFKINLDLFIKKVNGDKERIFILENGRWFITGFLKFQWFNKKDAYVLNLNNKLHQSIYNLLVCNQVPIEKVRGLKEVLQTSRDKDKDIISKEELELLLKEKKEKFKKTLEPFLDEFGKELLNGFYRYWAEATPNSRNLKWELEETWEIKLRLIRWHKNQEKFKK